MRDLVSSQEQSSSLLQLERPLLRPLLTGFGWSIANATEDVSSIALQDVRHIGNMPLCIAGLAALDTVTR